MLPPLLLLLLLASMLFGKALLLSPKKLRLIRLYSDNARINKLIEPESLKVVHSLELKAGEKCVLCRCWLSSKFPFCDGAHAAHNKATGDNVGPVIVTAPSVQPLGEKKSA